MDTWAYFNELLCYMLSSMFERAARSSRSISFKPDRWSFLINTNVEKLCLHKYVVQNWKRILRKLFSKFAYIIFQQLSKIHRVEYNGISIAVFCHFVVQESFLSQAMIIFALIFQYERKKDFGLIILFRGNCKKVKVILLM